MKEQPNYYSIIPANVRYDEDLKANEKLLYGEITALANKNGYCWAENNYFAELYGVKKRTVSGWVSNLEDKGYIRTKLIYQNGSRQVSKRYIYINHPPIEEKSNRVGDESSTPYGKNIPHPMEEKSKEELNNTSTNTTSTNTSSAKKGKIPHKEIIDYLNEKTEKKISYKSKGNRDLIQARWNEGYGLEDFKKVIDNKVEEWFGKGVVFSNGKPAENYLHPSTLFVAGNFDKYLNQDTQKPKDRSWEEWDFLN